MKTYKGKLDLNQLKVAIVISQYNDYVTNRLLVGALEGFKDQGFVADSIDVVYVPGVLEMPLISKQLIKKEEYDVIVCLGAVIKHEKFSTDFISNETMNKLTQLSIDTNMPIINGILMTQSTTDAFSQSDITHGNYGYQYAITAIEMVSLMQKVSKK
ncbi:MAG TPA: 6,7-dimethyl-8-ribityllumazine synthase [Alloiococcus sp.]|nr:6,7-dimethyl-8-ribityllumazine synthase [Alloiococcus sp.]